MRKILITALLASVMGQSLAVEMYTAEGSEPFWSLQLREIGDNKYRATFTRPGEVDVKTTNAVVTRHRHNKKTIYQGMGDNGQATKITVIHQSWQDDAKGSTWEDRVSVEGFGSVSGCGGDMIEDANEKESLEYAQKHNRQGFEFYKKEQYTQALSAFLHAMNENGTYRIAQYNYACTAALLREQMIRKDCAQELPNEQDWADFSSLIDEGAIIEELRKVAKYDKKRRLKMQKDSDLVSIRKLASFYLDALDYSPRNSQQVTEIVAKVAWHAKTDEPVYRHHAPLPTLDFDDNGKVTAVKTQTRDDGSFNPVKTTGSYRMDNATIKINFNGQTLDGHLDYDGVLHFTGAKSAGILPSDTYTSSLPMIWCYD